MKQSDQMKIVDAQNKDLMSVKEIIRDGNALVIKGKIFGTMPVSAKLTPQEARKGLKLLSFSLILFLISLPFRKG